MAKNRLLSLSVALALAASCLESRAATVVYDFSANDGGWTTSGSWSWDTQTWSTPGQFSGPVIFVLTSPSITVGENGLITGSFDHRFNFESPYDGGQFQYSADNGSTWLTVPENLIDSVTYNVTFEAGLLLGQRGFSGTSAGYGDPAYFTSTFTLGAGAPPYATGAYTYFTAGQEVQVRFLASWDDSIANPSPNWAVSSATLTTGVVPEPGTCAMVAMGFGTLFLLRKRKAA